MVNKSRVWLWFLLFCAPLMAYGTTFNISAGASLSTIASTITTAGQASGANTVLFAAGLYSVAWPNETSNSPIAIPCPSGSLVITGPTTTYDQPGVLNAWQARPTATLRNTNSGASGHLISLPAGCQNPITIQYLEIDANKPQTGGGSVYIGYNGGGLTAATSNITIQYNWMHGNQEITPVLCQDGTQQNGWGFCYDDLGNAALVYADGFHGTNSDSGSWLTNTNIVHNIFGNGSTSNVDAGDCGNVMEFVGGCTAQGNPAYYLPANCTPGTSGCNTCVFSGYDATGGACAAFGSHTNSMNLHFDYNKIIQQEQGTKWYEGGDHSQTYNIFFEVHDSMNNNDVGTYHRIGTEDQQSSVTNSSTLGNFPCTGGDGECMTHFNNFFHGGYNPSFGTWGFSLPNIGYHDEIGNTVVTSYAANSGGAGPADFEDWGFGAGNNNLDQGFASCAFSYGYNGSSQQIENNIWQQPNGNAGACSISPSLNNEEGQTSPIVSGNTFTTTVTAKASTAPTLSPNGGSFSGSQVVTLNDTGNTGIGPQGNTNLWCTTDNSAPAPFSGTSVYYNAGSTITLTSTTTLKCVGIWGTQNENAAAVSGYGWTPSSVVSATFTGGGTPTAASPVFSPASQNFTSSVSVTLSSSTPSSSIYYCTTTGCTPTTGSTLYTGAISVTSTTTISAIAVASGFANSSVSSATYTLTAPPQAAAPTFSPGTQTFTGTLNVTVSSTTNGATIYYTTDGSTPTTSSHVYTTTIAVTSTQTIKAIASASGFTNSAVGSATYTFALFLGNNLLDNSTSNTYPGAFNGIYAVTGSSSGGYTVTGCVVNQGTAAVTNGKHTACVLNLATSPTSEAANALCSGFYTNTSTSGTVAQITMSGCPTLTPNTAYWVSSITDDTLQPSGLGFNDCGSACNGGVPTSGVGTYASFYFAGTYGTYTGMTTSLSKGLDQVTQYLTLTTVTAQAATPVINPTSQTFTGTVNVSMTTTTPSSTIYYTTDGSTPTTSSTVYTAPFSISATTTVKAIAVASGFTNSQVASNTYNLVTGSISSVYITTASKVNFVVPGSSDQFTVNVQYSDGLVLPLVNTSTPDARGSKLTSIVSSNTPVATVSSLCVVTGVSNTMQPNWTLITATVTDSGGGTYTANWLEGVANSLTAGYK